MNVSTENVKEVIKQFTDMQKKIETNIGKGLAKCCQLVQVTAQKSMTNTKINTAVTYYNTNKSKGHHPSVAGNPPAVDTGSLRRSITYDVDEMKKEARVGSVITNPPYGAYLEFGTSKLQPRPWLKPALEENEKKCQQIMRNCVKEGIK